MQQINLNERKSQSLSAIDLMTEFLNTRNLSEKISSLIDPNAQNIQTMPDVSPTKWHLAHTSWFYETFILKKYLPSYKEFNNNFNYLFNSYYNSVGKQYPRTKRGELLSPNLSEIHEYRKYINENMVYLLRNLGEENHTIILNILELGLNHEAQHQELMLTDIKHVFFHNRQFPTLKSQTNYISEKNNREWLSFKEGIYKVGHLEDSFAFDNERPNHKTYIYPFKMSSSLITNEEYLNFINDSGYERSELWLSDGWDFIKSNQITNPLYFVKEGNKWLEFTLFGLQEINLNSPVTHINFYEANAFASWTKKRLPTEFEWEVAANKMYLNKGNLLDFNALHPRSEKNNYQFLGDCWEWTTSSYSPYPGFKPFQDGFAEYNGKFMCNQYVLKGGSCITPPNHMRMTYRNFFYPNASWQFSGIRLAEDLK